MSFFFYDARKPDDKFEPRVHTQDELDSMLIPMDRRDGCKDYYAEFKKCILVQHQTRSSFMSWKKAGREHCGYYFDHWNQCREVKLADAGLQTRNVC
jgi:hypothetical protein